MSFYKLLNGQFGGGGKSRYLVLMGATILWYAQNLLAIADNDPILWLMVVPAGQTLAAMLQYHFLTAGAGTMYIM